MNPVYFLIGLPFGFSAVFLLFLLVGSRTARRGRHRADDLMAVADATREQPGDWSSLTEQELLVTHAAVHHIHEQTCNELAVRKIASHGMDAIETHLREAS